MNQNTRFTNCTCFYYINNVRIVVFENCIRHVGKYVQYLTDRQSICNIAKSLILCNVIYWTQDIRGTFVQCILYIGKPVAMFETVGLRLECVDGHLASSLLISWSYLLFVYFCLFMCQVVSTFFSHVSMVKSSFSTIYRMLYRKLKRVYRVLSLTNTREIILVG